MMESTPATKPTVLGAFAIGVIGLAVGVSQPLDGQIIFCRPSANGCIERSIPEWMPLESGATGLKRIPGAVGQKLVGAILSVGAFWLAMSQARIRVEEELIELQQIGLEEARALKERQIQEQVALGFFRDATMLREAEANYAVLAPYQKAIEEAKSQAVAEAIAQGEAEILANPPAPLEAPKESDAPASKPDEVIPPPAPTSTPVPGAIVLDKDSEAVALAILDGLASSRRSNLLIGGTGAGKSVTDAYLLTKLFARHPETEAWAIAQKNDSFCGLDKKGRVTIFDATDPEPALRTIDHVYGIYDKRRRLPEHARHELSPVRLILADWLSINRALEEKKNEEPIKSSMYLVKLSDILFNGRELNVCLMVDLQSFNLAAIGIKSDRNSRKNFNIVGLGNYSVDVDGSINESYGVLSNMIGTHEILPEEEERTRLLAQFKALKPISLENQRPIIFTTLEPARVALLPDLRHYKPGQVAPIKIEGMTPEYLQRLFDLEFDIDKPKKKASEPELFSELHRKILTYLEGKGAKRPHDMQKSRPFEGVAVSAIREAIDELLKWGKIVAEGDDRYRLHD